jgi:pyruvate dehydrogenase complex dehydrogenase (E1) component
MGFQVEHRIVQKRGWDDAEIRNLAAGREQTREQIVMQPLGTQTAVPRKIDFPRVPANQVSADSLAKRQNAGIEEFGVGDTPNIVLAKNPRG